MKHISILVPRGAVALSCIEGPFVLFNQANQFLSAKGQPARFQVQLVGMDASPQAYHSLFQVRPDVPLASVQRTDLIIIPAVNGDMQQVIADNQPFLPWVVQQYKRGAQVASLCVGAFLLAATGLLAGKKCSTHWSAAHDFQQMFPQVHLVADNIITDEHGLYSSGGASLFWNLLLYLLEKYTDREIALTAAKYFALEINRTTQSPFVMFQGQKNHGDEVVLRAQEYIEQNYQARITVEQLTDTIALGRRNLERRFKKATANTIIEYIQRVKIEAAKQSLESSEQHVNEVMYNVGYTDNKAFRTTFKRITGLSPMHYRAKYNPLAAIG